MIAADKSRIKSKRRRASKAKRDHSPIDAAEVRRIFPSGWADILAKLRARWGEDSFWWTNSQFGKAFGIPTWKARRWIARQRKIILAESNAVRKQA